MNPNIVQVNGQDVILLPMDKIVTSLAAFYHSYPVIGLLFILIISDIIIGLVAAFITETVSSSTSQKGMAKKIINLLLIGVAASIEPWAQGMPLSNMAATGFAFTELISITENAARAGVPIPGWLKDVLIKLKTTEQQPTDNKSVVNISRASNVDIHNIGETDSSKAKPLTNKNQDSQIVVSPLPPDSNNPDKKENKK